MKRSCTDNNRRFSPSRYAAQPSGSGHLISSSERFLAQQGLAIDFGLRLNDSGSGTTDLNFTGQNQDTASGLYDFLYREYHSAQGR